MLRVTTDATFKRSRIAPRGHAYDEENTYWLNGTRRCRACHRETEAKRQKGLHRAGTKLKLRWKADHEGPQTPPKGPGAVGRNGSALEAIL